MKVGGGFVIRAGFNDAYNYMMYGSQPRGSTVGSGAVSGADSVWNYFNSILEEGK